MKNLQTITASVLLLTLLAVTLLSLPKANASQQADSFWTEAAQGGMAEVMLSEAAVQKAQDSDVRAFAQQMVTDHTAANNELKQAAAGKSITLPTAVSAKQQAAATKLNSMSGADFDREYMKTMVKDHEKMVKLFEKTSERSTDAEAKSFAAKTLPTLQSHLTSAKNLNDQVKGNGRSGGTDDNTASNSNNNSRSDRNDTAANRSNSNRRGNSNSNSNNTNNR